MNRIRTAAVAAALVGVVAAGARLGADVKTEERGTIKFEGTLGRMMGLFGGRAAKEGVVSTVGVKGSRKITANEQNGQIIDLAEEKVYDLDFRKKTYKATTFEELRRRLREAQERAEIEAQEAGKTERTETRDEPTGKEMEIDFTVKDTGQKKSIAGYDAREVVMTVTVREKGRTLEEGGGLVLTADTWLAPKIAAMKEIMEFDLRYAQAIQGPFAAGTSAEAMAAALALYPMLKPALGKIQSENVTLDGTPLETVTVVEAVKSKEQRSAEASQEGESGGGLGGMLARRMMRKKDDQKPRPTVFTLTHEVLKVSTDVAPSDVAIPAGFKEKT
jgi:hypothetical protein